MKYILSIDQGTTSSRAVIIDQSGKIVASHQQAFEQIFPKPGWVEHNPEEIWTSVKDSVAGALQKGNISGNEIAAIGITNQRETVVVWDKKTNRPIYNAIVWQCRRTADFCAKLKSKDHKLIRSLTGTVVDPYFSGSKIRWILKNVAGASEKAKKKEIVAGNIDTFLIWRLTEGKSFCTDVSNASRTQLMNIHKGTWDDKLLKLFSVPKEMLAQISDSSGVLGKTSGLNFLPDGIPISGVAGDQQAALFGQTCFEVGEAKCTFGTGSFMLLNTGAKAVKSKSGVLTTVAWRLQNQKMIYALEGGAFICGAAVQWLRDGLKLIAKSSEVEALAKEVKSSEGVEFVPALTGLGAPYWNSEARGVICGLTRGSTKAHIARATLEAMALQNAEILFSMQKDLGKKMKALRVDGGATANNLLMQLQADYLGVLLTRPQVTETTVMGAAYLAGLGIGFWKDIHEIKSIWKADCDFHSEMNQKQRGQRLQTWQKAVQRALL
ncbi:MAG: glycerol kinase GlpK [Pseudobdellovibrionaceae bacterium]